MLNYPMTSKNNIKIGALKSEHRECLSFVSCCCDKIPWQKQPRGKRICFILQFQVTVHDCQKVTVAGV